MLIFSHRFLLLFLISISNNMGLLSCPLTTWLFLYLQLNFHEVSTSAHAQILNSVLIFVSFVISNLWYNYLWPAFLHLFCHLRRCIFSFFPSVLSLLSFFLCFKLTFLFSVWTFFKTVSKFRRNVSIHILLLCRNKKKSAENQVEPEGFVIGVFCGADGKIWPFCNLQNRRNKNVFPKYYGNKTRVLPDAFYYCFWCIMILMHKNTIACHKIHIFLTSAVKSCNSREANLWRQALFEFITLIGWPERDIWRLEMDCFFSCSSLLVSYMYCHNPFYSI